MTEWIGSRRVGTGGGFLAGRIGILGGLVAAGLLAATPGAGSGPTPAEQAGHATHDAIVHHEFKGAEAWAEHFEDPARDAWQLPDQVIEALVSRDDLIVADIGSATGYFPVRFARSCPKGRVIGADIEPEMVFYLNDRARREDLPNLVSILAAPDDPHLPAAADLIFICDTYHHIDARVDYFTRLKSLLRPGGRVAIIDFKPFSAMGPPHKLDPKVVMEEMEEAGYRLVKQHEILPEQYFLEFAAK